MSAPRLPKVKFDAAFADGLLEMEGYEFECAGRKLVIHRSRPGTKSPSSRWCVSDKLSGYSFGEVRGLTLDACIRAAHAVAESKGLEEIAASEERAMSHRPKHRVGE